MRSNRRMDCTAPGRARRWGVVWNIRAEFLGLWIVGATACGQGVTDSGIRHSRVVLDVRSLLAAPLSGDFVTVADTARLTISSGGTQTTQTRVLGPGEFETDFDVSVKSGAVTFGIDVISDSGTLLYTGETSATIDADGFAVTIIPQAVHAVMVVLPGRPIFKDTVFTTGSAVFRISTDTLRVRNAGPDTLRWRVEAPALLPQGVSFSCAVLPGQDDNCLQELPWAPGRESAILLTFIRPNGTVFQIPQSIKFLSNVGSATAQAP